MKVIELLNRIANDEEVPKKIKYKSFILERTKSSEVKRLYVDEQGMFFPEYYSFELNDEVEVIEKIEKLDYVRPEIECSYNESELLLRVMQNKNKINEIIDKINKD